MATKSKKDAKKPAVKKAAKKAATKKMVAKRTVKKVAPKKPVSKKAASKKPAKKIVAKTPVKKVVPQKTVAKKPVPKKVVTKGGESRVAKPEVVKTGAPDYEPIPTLKQMQAPKEKAGGALKQERFSASDLKVFKHQMLEMRERMISHADTMKDMALKGMDDVNPEEDGTDAHMRMVTLQQLGTQRTILAKIEEALVAIEKGTYGICDNCGCRIGKQRLQAQPFSKTCINCQSEMERLR